MTAVLENALEVMRTRGFGHRALVQDTERWFFSDDFAWPFSFRNVCAALGVDPVAIRQTVEGLRRPRRAAA